MIGIERDTRVLIVAHFVANTVIGVSLYLWANLSAESVLGSWSPSWLWPGMFVLAGLMAFVGIWNRTLAQFAFIFAAIVTGIFGLASLYAVLAKGMLAAIPTTVFLLHITLLKVALSKRFREREDILRRVAESTAKGQSVLDGVTNGANHP